MAIEVSLPELGNSAFGPNLSVICYDNETLIGEYNCYLKDEALRPYGFWVLPEYRGRGLGETMMRSVIETGITLGANKIEGFIESQHTIRIRERLFGDAIEYSDELESGEKVILPISNAQAIAILEQAELFEQDLERRTIGIRAECKLEDYIPLNTSDQA